MHTTDSITQPAPIRRAFVQDALIAHRSYLKRAKALLRAARTPDDIATARGFMQSATGEVAYWQAALETCDG